MVRPTFPQYFYRFLKETGSLNCKKPVSAYVRFLWPPDISGCTPEWLRYQFDGLCRLKGRNTDLCVRSPLRIFVADCQHHKSFRILISVVDPYIYYTDPDPDPALFSIYGSGSRLFYDTNIIFLKFFFLIFQFISYFVWLWRNSFKTDEKIWKDFKQIFKKVIKYSRCLNLWSVFKLLDPDPYIIYGSGSGSRRANNIRIRLDPDPQHC